MKIGDCTDKHTRITFILLDDLDNLTRDDNVIREMVHDRFEHCYSDKRWAKDMRWNRRFIYTTIGFLERKSEYGDPTTTDAERAIAAACDGDPDAKGLAGLVFGAIGDQLDVPPGLVKSPNFNEGKKWAECYAEELSNRSPNERECIRAIVREQPTMPLEKADKLLRLLWDR